MMNLKIRYLIVILLLIVTASAVSGLYYDASRDEEEPANLQAIPMQIGKRWRGQDLPLEEMVYDILETRAIIHRLFTANNGDTIFLSVVHYQDTKVDFHSPEACIGGRGLKTTKTTKIINCFVGDQRITLDVAEMVTMRATDQTLSYYFYKSGQFVGSNYVKMRLNIATNKLFRNDARGSMIRIATAMTSGKEAEAEALLTDFLEDFFPYIQQSL